MQSGFGNKFFVFNSRVSPVKSVLVCQDQSRFQYHFQGLIRPHLSLIWASSGPLWASSGPLSGLLWAPLAPFGPPLSLIWTSFGPLLGLFWASFGTPLDLLWASSGPRLGQLPGVLFFQNYEILFQFKIAVFYINIL